MEPHMDYFQRAVVCEGALFRFHVSFGQRNVVDGRAFGTRRGLQKALQVTRVYENVWGSMKEEDSHSTKFPYERCGNYVMANFSCGLVAKCTHESYNRKLAHFMSPVQPLATSLTHQPHRLMGLF